MDTNRDSTLIRQSSYLTTSTQQAVLNSADVDLDEEVPRMLESVNPLAPKSLVKFNYGTGAFESAPAAPPTISLMHLESSAVLKSSAEALDDHDDNFCSLLTLRPSLGKVDDGVPKDKGTEVNIVESCEDNEGEAAVEDDDADEDEEEPKVQQATAGVQRRAKKTPNAFNFCETGAQTAWSTYETNETQTVPLARAGFEAVFTPSKIYDAYAADYEQIQTEKALAANEPIVASQPEPRVSISTADLADRVINQNIYDDISFDFGYYEDRADEFRSTGSLLPLWRFYKPGMSTNKMDWNPIYLDLIAVAFGVPDFDSVDEDGYIILYTMKNPSHPVYSRKTSTGVLSLAFNVTLPHLLAVGFYDGHVAVYDTSSSDETPLYKSCYSISHTRGVSELKWTGKDSLGDEGFLSISYDGFVKRWIVKKSGLEGTSAMIISLGKGITGPGGMTCAVHGSGYTIQLDPLRENEYFVGTCSGEIQKYNIQHGESIMNLKAHDLPVRRIFHNVYIPKYFLSCSEDWNVKLWEDGRESPLMTFDLGHPVIDVSWSPYTSTVFAAISTDGYLHIFDLHMDRQRPICRQGVVSVMHGREPSRLFFNQKFPIVAIGDTRGSVLILKLSPNLRVPAKPSKKEYVEPWELEIRKLEKVLSYCKPLSNNLRTDSQINHV